LGNFFSFCQQILQNCLHLATHDLGYTRACKKLIQGQ
jgi:hypothetical protein